MDKYNAYLLDRETTAEDKEKYKKAHLESTKGSGKGAAITGGYTNAITTTDDKGSTRVVEQVDNRTLNRRYKALVRQMFRNWGESHNFDKYVHKYGKDIMEHPALKDVLSNNKDIKNMYFEKARVSEPTGEIIDALMDAAVNQLKQERWWLDDKE